MSLVGQMIWANEISKFPLITIFHLLLGVVVEGVIEVVIEVLLVAAFVVFEFIAVGTGVALNDIGINDVTAVPKRSHYLV